MAGNFWNSSHCQQWLLTKEDIVRERQVDLQILSEDEYQKVMIFYANVIQTIGEQLKARQQVIATAIVYFKRFYCLNSLKSIDPLLMAPTCIFLASKVEEFGPISNSKLINTVHTQCKTKFSYAFNQEFTYRVNQIHECEFFLLEQLDCCLVVYHPYRALTQYVADMKEDQELFQLAWRIINDSLRTDVCLLFPPFQIALACLHMACVILKKDDKQWFAELSVDMDKILEITRYMQALYELWKNYDEKVEIKSILMKMPKHRSNPPSRPPSQGAGSDGTNR